MFLGFLECQPSFFIIVTPGLLHIFSVNYGVFLSLKLVPPLHLTLRVMGKVSAPIAHLNKPLSASLYALPFTEFKIYSTISQSTGYSPFFILYGQEVPLSFNHALTNPSDSTMQPSTTSSSTKTSQNSPTQSYTTNAPEIGKKSKITFKMQKKTNAKSIVIPKTLLSFKI